MSPLAVAGNDLHAKLRNATRAAHRVLDHHPLLAPLVRPGLTIKQYGDALLGLQGVHAALEEQIAHYFEGHPGGLDYSCRCKQVAINADLVALGRHPLPWKLAFDAFEEGGIGRLVGVLYPLEGSMMGAQVIVRQLRESGLGHLPLRFLTCYGDQASLRWSEYLAWAEAICPADQHDQAVCAADQMFSAIASHLDAVHRYLAKE